jgi:VanZ family protein
MSWHFWLVRVAWLVAVALLTYALLTPNPVGPLKESMSEEAFFVSSKIVHVSAYALLTLLLILSRWPRLGTCLGVAFLSLHAFATEYLQTFVPGRVGTLRDVGFDHLGIAVGLLLARVFWRRGGRTASGGSGRPGA